MPTALARRHAPAKEIAIAFGITPTLTPAGIIKIRTMVSLAVRYTLSLMPNLSYLWMLRSPQLTKPIRLRLNPYSKELRKSILKSG